MANHSVQLQTDETAFAAGGCGALAAAFRNYDMLSAQQRRQLLQVSSLSKLFNMPPAHIIRRWFQDSCSISISVDAQSKDGCVRTLVAFRA